ncbi:MAG: hypothetical protein WDZ59_05445 [Pirellulales bacterium]
MRSQAWTLALAAVLTAAVVVGCGGDSSGQTELPPEIDMLATQLASNSREEESFQQSFASGATVPEDRERYSNYQYRVMEKTVDGNTATLQVRVSTFEGNELGTEQWTATQEGETWKLTAAPLPAGAEAQ